MVAIIQSTRKMPYSMRFIARETLLSLRVSWEQPIVYCITHVGSGKISRCTRQGLRSLYCKAGFLQIPQPGYSVRSVHPTSRLFFDFQSSAPETFDMVSTPIDVASRKNLAQISQVLTQIASGSEFSEDSPQFIPINEMVRKTVAEMTVWMLQSDYSPPPWVRRRYLTFMLQSQMSQMLRLIIMHMNSWMLPSNRSLFISHPTRYMECMLCSQNTRTNS